MVENSLQRWVDTALDTAVFENGYADLMTQGPEEVADDLIRYNARERSPHERVMNHDVPFEESDRDEVISLVRAYQRWYEVHGKD